MHLSAFQLKGTNLNGFSDRITGSNAGNPVDRFTPRGCSITGYGC